jgi:hypothetical protein
MKHRLIVANFQRNHPNDYTPLIEAHQQQGELLPHLLLDDWDY